MKIWITSAIVFGLALTSYYFYVQVESLESAVEAQKELIESQKLKIKELNTQIIFEKKVVEDQNFRLEEYKNKTEEIKTVIKPVVVYKEIVKTLPKEVIVETANEDTNEIITSISNSADLFSGVHNN